MQAEKIKATLRQLHKSLEAKGSVDPELRKLLQKLDDDIHKLLAGQTQPPADAASLVTRIEDMATRFAVQHPQAGGILRGLADALGKMGI